MKEEIETMEEEIEKIDDDIRLVTDDFLKLISNSKPQLETKEKFYEIIERENMKAPEGYELRAIMDRDLITHLNQHALEGELFKEWSATSTAFFKTYAFFLEMTKPGRQLRESDKIWTLDKKYPSLGGIARWVEIEAMDRLKTKDYDFDKILPEIMNELESGQYYKFYKICRKLWDMAYKSDLSRLYASESKKAEPNEIIAASILCASSDISKDFNKAFIELENMSIPDIFDKSGLYIIRDEKLIPATELDYMEKCIKELGFGIGIERQIGEIKECLKKIEEKSLQLGEHYENNSLKEIGGQALQLYKIIESHPYKFRIKEIPDPETYTTLLQTFVNDSGNFLKSFR